MKKYILLKLILSVLSMMSSPVLIIFSGTNPMIKNMEIYYFVVVIHILVITMFAADTFISGMKRE